VRNPGGPASDLVVPGPHGEPTGHDRDGRVQGVGLLHSACLAARVSGGLKSRSARGHGPISKGGGNASLAEVGGRYGEAYTGTKAKAGDSQGGPAATTKRASEGRAPTARWGLKGLRRTTGSSSKGAIPQMNRSAQDGEWSSLHYGGEGAWFHPIAPRCVRATRWGRGAGDPGRPGIVQAAGMVEIM
jgi:hypothetical protein